MAPSFSVQSQILLELSSSDEPRSGFVKLATRQFEEQLGKPQPRVVGGDGEEEEASSSALDVNYMESLSNVLSIQSSLSEAGAMFRKEEADIDRGDSAAGNMRLSDRDYSEEASMKNYKSGTLRNNSSPATHLLPEEVVEEETSLGGQLTR